MEKSRGLSTELKQKIAVTKIAIIGEEATEPIARAIDRMGFTDVVITEDSLDLPQCDVAICSCTEKQDCLNVIRHCNEVGVAVICTFNFGIGACVTVVPPGKTPPHFVSNKADDDTVISMLEYVSGYSAFWHQPQNSWVDKAGKYICTPEVRASIGENTMTAMTAHLLIALIAGNNLKTYPKFYLSTIANDVN